MVRMAHRRCAEATPTRIVQVAGAKAKAKELNLGEFTKLYKAVQPWMVEASQLTALVEASKRGKLKIGPVADDMELVAKTFEAIDLNGDGKIDIDELSVIFGKKIGVTHMGPCRVQRAARPHTHTHTHTHIELHEFEAFVELIGGGQLRPGRALREGGGREGHGGGLS